MTIDWTPKDTSSHQDHVIAHVLGATLLGYFVFDEVLHILLDIGFVWTILLDGEMGLLPHPVTLKELEVEEQVRAELKADIEILLNNGAATKLNRFIPPPVPCEIRDVGFFANRDQRRLLITGETAKVIIETSLTSAEIQVYAEAVKSEG